MRIQSVSVLGVLLVSALACTKQEPAPTPPPSASATPTPASAAPPSSSGANAPAASTPAPSASSAAAPEAASAVPDMAPSDTPPESFADAAKIENSVAKGLGCEVYGKEGWEELLCRKKSGTGGHPKRAVLGAEGESPEIVPDDKGELRVTYKPSENITGLVEWTDAKYNLAVTGGELKLEWAVTLEHRRACAKLAKDSKAAVAEAQKAEGPDHLTAAEASKLPRFGICQPAGLGSWALNLREVSSAATADAGRHVLFVVDVAYVAMDGTVTRSELGRVEARPGGFEVRPLQIYDYDDDGSDEVIVPFDLKAVPKGTQPAGISPVWTFKDGKVAPYLLPATIGGAVTTHLEFDMRPDIGSYEPFVAYLDTDCGGSSCPPRLVGPIRYARSMPSGLFSLTDPRATDAITRACPKSATLVVAGNPGQTAKNIACARLRGDDQAKLEADVKASASALCKAAGTETCALLDALLGFVKAPLDEKKQLGQLPLPAELGNSAVGPG